MKKSTSYKIFDEVSTVQSVDSDKNRRIFFTTLMTIFVLAYTHE